MVTPHGHPGLSLPGVPFAYLDFYLMALGTATTVKVVDSNALTVL